MNLIVVSKSHRTWNFRLGPVLVGLVMFVSVSIAVSFFWLGSRYGSVQTVNHVSESYARAGDLWSQELLEQRSMITEARKEAQKHLD
ncbi:MAG: hypothetical protein R3318_06805, partial [Gammaproteobacteria bacterium]|nr:hypothetical protein [Gammaproteobacteria bacterium]